jgi:hypothetical protein
VPPGGEQLRLASCARVRWPWPDESQRAGRSLVRGLCEQEVEEEKGEKEEDEGENHSAFAL